MPSRAQQAPCTSSVQAAIATISRVCMSRALETVDRLLAVFLDIGVIFQLVFLCIWHIEVGKQDVGVMTQFMQEDKSLCLWSATGNLLRPHRKWSKVRPRTEEESALVVH